MRGRARHRALTNAGSSLPVWPKVRLRAPRPPADFFNAFGGLLASGAPLPLRATSDFAGLITRTAGKYATWQMIFLVEGALQRPYALTSQALSDSA